MSQPDSVHRDLGLTDDEYAAICARLEREPSYTELAMFSVMWSEHCSYKSSRVHLKTLPTEGERILVGPGEGAGIIEVADGVAVAWKIESHNHPSFVEPFNGAATGVGGIVRDILSMGARPIALMDPLRFGPLDDARTRYTVDGVVHGISSYGNSIGVPTMGGETVFDDCYAENPLVNVACLGVIDTKLMHGRAEKPGQVAVLFGSSTGRDGIGGASVLASAEFDEDSLDKRPSVQVGDPFSEKLLIECSLELISRNLVASFQDLGAGGISCPASEMTAKGGTGIRIDLDNVHRREPHMEPFEVMISESQERMLAVVEPDDVKEVLAVCAKWELEARVLGNITNTGRVEVVERGRVVADVPSRALAEEGPVYQRSFERPRWIAEVNAASCGDDAPEHYGNTFLQMISSPQIASKRWIWEQYDHMIFLGTVIGPGGDAAVIRLPGTETAVAISTDGSGRLCFLDPYEGARHAVAEAARNVASVGARPTAITNCLNFGSPERGDVMWQFAEVVRGIGDACRALGTPVTGGNVSFYNETNGRPVYPTPVVGMLGILGEPAKAVGVGFRDEGDAIVALGTTEFDDFGGSDYGKIVHGAVGGIPPPLDMVAEKSLHQVLIAGADAGLFNSAHDLAGGGLAVALAESAFASEIGFSVQVGGAEPHRALYSESPARAIVSCPQGLVDDVLALAGRHRVAAEVIGSVGKDMCDFSVFAIPLDEARSAWEDGLSAPLSATMG
ncbi:MAG: phosphoribosylformylglycinamidine synthase subunit PurL [Actinomycetota bacterium]